MHLTCLHVPRRRLTRTRRILKILAWRSEPLCPAEAPRLCRLGAGCRRRAQGGAVLTGGCPPGKRAHSQEEAPRPTFICKVTETPLQMGGAGSGPGGGASCSPREIRGGGHRGERGCGPAARARGARGHCLHGDWQLPRPRGCSSGLWGRDAVSHVAPPVWSAPHVQWLPGAGPPY